MSKQEKEKMSPRKRGVIELVGGVALAAIGGIASYISYDTAKVGQTYTVYTGVIALGVVYAFKGLYDIAFPNGFGKKGTDADNAKIDETAKDTEVVEED